MSQAKTNDWFNKLVPESKRVRSGAQMLSSVYRFNSSEYGVLEVRVYKEEVKLRYGGNIIMCSTKFYDSKVKDDLSKLGFKPTTCYGE